MLKGTSPQERTKSKAACARKNFASAAKACRTLLSLYPSIFSIPVMA